MKTKTILRSLLIIVFWTILGIACGPACGDAGHYKVTAYEVAEVEGETDPNFGEVSFSFPAELKSSDTVEYQYLGYQINPSVTKIALNNVAGIFQTARA